MSLSLAVVLSFAVVMCAGITIERIAFGSCFNPNRGGKIWSMIRSFNPQQLVLLGDQFYADMTPDFVYRKTNLSLIQQEYAAFAGDPDWKSLAAVVGGWMATFDDHDYGVNNGDSTFRHRNASQDLFWNFTGMSPLRADGQRKSGVHSSRTISVNSNSVPPFLYKIILLDGRSNKNRKGATNGDFLGAEQWEWLVAELLDPAPSLFLIGSGIQVLPTDKLVEETWDEFPAMRQRLLKLVTAVKLDGGQRSRDVVFLSGDIHSAEVSQARCSLRSVSAKHGTVGSAKTRDRQWQLVGENSGGAGSGGVSDVDRAGVVSASRAAVAAELLPVVELTSSGLAHTFTMTSVRPQEQQRSNTAHPHAVPVRSRGFWKQFFFGLYQAVYPAQYRENKYGHFYGGLHFGLLDVLATGDGSAEQGRVTGVRFRAIDHQGDTVIDKTVQLFRGETTGATSPLSLLSIGAMYSNDPAAVLRAIDGEVALHCEPFWGHLPRYKLLLCKLMLALAAFLLVIVPFVGVLCALFSALYRVTRGHDDAEEARRVDRIREIQQILGEQNAGKKID